MKPSLLQLLFCVPWSIGCGVYFFYQSFVVVVNSPRDSIAWHENPYITYVCQSKVKTAGVPENKTNQQNDY